MSSHFAPNTLQVSFPISRQHICSRQKSNEVLFCEKKHLGVLDRSKVGDSKSCSVMSLYWKKANLVRMKLNGNQDSHLFSAWDDGWTLLRWRCQQKYKGSLYKVTRTFLSALNKSWDFCTISVLYDFRTISILQDFRTISVRFLFCTISLRFPYDFYPVEFPYDFCATSVRFPYDFCATSVRFPYDFCAISALFLFSRISARFLRDFCTISVLYDFRTISERFMYDFCPVRFPYDFCAISVLYDFRTISSKIPSHQISFKSLHGLYRRTDRTVVIGILQGCAGG